MFFKKALHADKAMEISRKNELKNILEEIDRKIKMGDYEANFYEMSSHAQDILMSQGYAVIVSPKEPSMFRVTVRWGEKR